MLAASGAALGQTRPAADEGPLIVGQSREAWKLFRLDHWDSSIDFLGQWRQDKRTSDTGPDVRDTEGLLRETFNLSTRSFIGHENLMDLRADVRIGLEDTFTDSGSQGVSQHDSSVLDLYDLRALILGKGPAPVTVYTRRDQTLLQQEFAGTIDSTTTEHGVTVQAFGDTLPTVFNYFHREQQQSDQLGLTDSRLRQDTFSVQSQWALTPHQRITLDYAFDDIHESQGAGVATNYQRHDATLTHNLGFGPQDRSSLRSSARIYDQEGDFARRDLRLDELLLLRHTDRLESRYNLVLQDREVAGLEQQAIRGNASVRHKLFESLVSTASAGGSHDSIGSEFTSDQAFGDVGLQYTKKVPYGRLDASAGFAYNHTVDSEQGSDVTIADEGHTFNDPLPIVISRRDVLAGSIVVSNSAGILIYSEGLDYTVRALPDRAEIFRVVGGRIADGQTVLVDYVIGPEPGNTIDTFATTVSARYGINEGWFSGVSLYVTYQQIDRTLDTVDPSGFVLDDSRRLLYGAEYRIGEITLRGEREQRESTVSPSVTNRLQGRYDRSLGPGSFLAIVLTHEDTRYTAEDNRVELNRAEAQWRESLGRDLDLRLRLLYRDEHNEFAGDSRGLEQNLELHWRKRQTEISVSINNSLLEGEHADTLSQTFSVGLRRSF